MAASSSAPKTYTTSVFDRIFDNDLINSRLFPVIRSSYNPGNTYLHFFKDSIGKLSCFSVFPPIGTDGTKLVFIYFHGNACDLGDCENKLKTYAYWFDCTVIGIEYAGYGCCQGERTQESIIKKAVETIDYMVSRLNVPVSRIVLFGHSVGCAIALKVNTHFDGGFAGVILQSPFFNIKKMAEKSFFSFMLTERSVFNNADEILSMAKHQRLMIIHGKKDEVISVDQSRDLYAMSTLPPTQKTFHIDPMANHNVFDKIKLRFEIMMPFIRECIATSYPGGRGNLIVLVADGNLLDIEKRDSPGMATIRNIFRPMRDPIELAWIGADGTCCTDMVDETKLYMNRYNGNTDDQMLKVFLRRE